MTLLWTLAGLAFVYALALLSPGPNVFLVMQLSLSGQRRLGWRVVAGVAIGSTLWAIAAMAGVATLIDHAHWLRAAIRLAGAAYLIWFGAKLLRASRAPADKATPHVRAPTTAAAAFRLGLLTNLTNPKAAAFWTSIFGSMFPAHAPAWLFVATAAVVAAMSGGWHASLMLLFASARMQAGYARLRRPIDAGVGMLLVGLGVGLGAGLAASR